MLFAACSSELPHEAPFDPNAPLEKQARASLAGTVRLEGESDNSQVTLDLQNEARTYNVDTAADGVVSLTGIVPGEYTLKIRTRYFQPVTETLTVDMGETIDLGTRVLPPLRSRVLGLATSESVKGTTLVTSGGVSLSLKKTASVRVAVASAPAFRAAAAAATAVTIRTTSGIDGNYAFDEVPAGGYRLYASTPETGERAVGDVTVTGEGDVTVDPIVLRPLTGFFEILGSANGAPSKLYTSVPNVNLQLQQSNAVQVKVAVSTDGTPAACNLAAAAPEALPANTLRPLTFTSEGKKLVCVSYVDSEGKETEPLYGTITYDATPPGPLSVTPVVAGGFIKTYTQLVNIAAVDTLSGVAMMATSATSSFAGAVPTAFQPTVSIPYASPGSHTTYIRIYDAAGNFNAVPLTVSVVVDPSAPAVAGGSTALLTPAGAPAGATIHESKLVLVSSVDDGLNTALLEMQITVDGRSSGWEPYSPNKLFELNLPTNPAGEPRTISALVRDPAGNVATLLSPVVLTLDTLAPAGTLDIVAAAVTAPAIQVQALSADAFEVELAFDPGFVTSLGRFSPGLLGITLPSGDGAKSVYGRFFDAAGNASGLVGDTVTLDTTPPIIQSFSIAQASPTKLNSVDVLYSASGAAELRITEGAACGGARVAIGSGSQSLTLSASEGTKSVSLQFFDAAGNASECAVRTIYYDPNPPVVGTLQLNYGQAATSSNVVTITFPGVSGASRVMLSEDAGFTGVNWDGFAPAKTFTLSAGNGVKTVFAKVADDAGNVVNLPQQQITLDTTPPTTPSIYAAVDVTTQTAVLLTLSAGLVSEMWLTQDDPAFTTGAWEPFTGSKVFALTGTDGTKTLYAKFKKSTGLETVVVSDTVVLDRTAPTLPSVRINNGATVLTSNIVTLNLSAVDVASGLATYKVNSTNDFSAVSPKPYQPTDVFSFAAGDGLKTVWVMFYDKAGNFSAAVSATALLDGSNPVVGAASLELLDGTPVLNGETVRESRLRLVSSVGDLTALEMQVSTNGSFTGVAWEPYSASKVIDLPSSGTPTIAARVRDQAGHIVTLLSGINVAIDTTAPVGTVTRTSAAVTNSTAVDLLISANEAGDAQVSDDPAFSGAVWYPTASTTYILSAGDGSRTIYVRWRDAAGNVSAAKTVQVTLDQSPPQLASFSIAQGSQTNQLTVSLLLSAAGADSMRVVESATCGGAWEAYATSKGFTFGSSTNEAKTISVQFKDNAGNLTGCLTRSITLDTQAPTFTAGKGVVINNDDVYTTSRTASLALNVTGATEIMLSESSTFVGAAWQAAVTATSWTFSAGEGLKTIYLKVRDAAGNETALQSDAVTLDTIAPAFNTASGASVSALENITISLAASGAAQMRLSENADFSGASYSLYNASAPFTLSSVEGAHTVYIQLADAAGNESIVRSVSVTLDKSAPSAPVVSALEGAFTGTASINLQILAAGAAEMLVSQYAPMTDATWQPYSQLKAFTLSGAQGAKTIYVKVRDGALNESAPSTTSITYDAAGPNVTLFQAEDAGGAVITQTNQTRFYLRLAVTDATPVTVQFNTSDAWSGIPSEAVQPLRAWDAAPPTLAAGENRNVYVRAVDAAGNATVVGPVTVLVDTLGPTAPSIAIAPSLVSSPTVTVSLSAVNADGIELSEDISFLAPTVVAYTTSLPYTFLNTADGTKTLYARYVDALGNYSGIVVASVTLDQSEPKFASFTIAQASPTKSGTVNLALTAVGADFMAISENACATNWEAYQTAKAYAFATTVNGAKTIAVRFKDTVGNATGCLTQTIDLDTQAPQFLVNPFRINYGDAATSNSTVTLVFNVASATEVRVSEDSSLADAAWVPYSATRTFGLSAGNGTKIIYAQFRDAAGNTTAIINDTIVLDTTQVGAPYISIQTDVTSSTTVTVNLGASNIDEMILSDQSNFSTGTGWVGYTGVTTYTFGGADGVKTLFAKFRKISGAETAVVSDSYILDRAAPSFSQLLINNGAQYTTSNQLTLALTGVDDTSGVQIMEVYEDGNVAVPQAYVPALVFPVSAAQGLKIVWVRFADRANNYAAPVSAMIVHDSTAPVVASFTVEDNAGNPLTISNSARVVVHIQAVDANPLQMLVSNRSDFAGSAWQPYQEYLQWDLPLPSLAAGEARTVYAKVRDAAGAVVTAGSYPLSLDTIAPASVAIDILGSAITTPTVTVNFTYSNADVVELSQDPGFQTKLTFAALASTTYTFAAGDGAKTLYARFADNAGNLSATVVDQVTLDSTAPQLASFVIAEGTLTNQTTLSLSLTAIDAAQMQIREGATCGGTWEPFATNKALPISGTEGMKTLAVRYRDAAGNTTACLTKSITLDTTAPAYTAGKGIVINGDAPFTTSRTVTLALNVTDATQVMISENGTFVGASWQPAVTSTTWNLGAGEGAKTLYLKARDAAGNETAGQFDVITVDTVAPSFSSVTGPTVTSVEGISLAIAASGATKMRLSENADLGAVAYAAFNVAPGFTLGPVEGAHTIYVQLADDAGNESLIRSVTVTLDKSAPTAPVVSVLEGAYTKTAAVTLQILASGAAEMLVSQYAPMTDATWQPYSQLKAFTFAGGDGAKTVYVRLRDGAGNPSAPSSASIVLDATGPSVTLFEAQDAGGNVITQTNLTRFYLHLAATDATPMTVQFNATSSWSGVPPEALQTVRAWDAAPPVLAAGENRTVYARVVDAAGNATVVGPVTVLVDTLGPTAPSIAIAPSLVSSPTVTVSLSAVNADSIELSEDISFLAPTVVAYTTSLPYTFLNTADGTKTLYARYVDALGNYSGIVVASVTLDQSEPKFASFTIAQASPTKSGTVNLALTAVGADFMAISENACATNWEAYQTAKAYAFATTVNGAKTIAVRFKDTVGNATGCLTQTIDFDNQAPQFLASPFRINYGDAATSNATVTLVSNVAGATEIRVSEDSSLADAAWTPYSATRTLVLSAGNGTKTVYAQYRDTAGNETAIINDTIVLDTTQVGAPYISIQTDVTSSTTVTVNLGASNIDEMILSDQSNFSTGTGWVGYTGVTTYTFGGADGVKTLFAKFRKISGAETAVVSDNYILDRAAPNFSQLLINNGAQYTTSNQLTLALTGVDDTSGVQVMEVYEDGDAPAQQAYVPALVFPVSAPQGLKIVWVRFADRANNYAAPVSAMIVYDSMPPVVSSFTVEDAAGNALSVASSARVVVHLVAADANPLQMLVSNRSDFAGSAWQPYQDYLQWDLPLPTLAGGEARTVYAKVRDAAGAIVGAGSYGLLLDTLSPSNAGVDILGSATTSPTVSVNLTYSNADFVELSADAGFQTKISFAAVAATTYTFTGGDGVKTLYARYRDNAYNYSATVVDQITLDTTPPQLASFVIDEGNLTNQTTLNLSLTAIDAAQMQIRENATCGGTWDAFAITKVLPITAANGLKTVAVRYRDAAGNTTACLTKTITLDTAPPALTAAKGVVINGDAPFTKNGVVNVALNVTGATSMMLSNSAAFGGAQYVPVTSATQWTLEPGDGTRIVYVRFKDAAGNVLDGGNDAVVVDTTPPANPSVAVNAGASYTAVTSVTLTLGATDAQPLQMQLSNDGVFDTEPLVAYAASSAGYLATGDGVKTVYARFVDAAGNMSAVASTTIVLDTAAPQGTSVVIDGGAASTSDLLGNTVLTLAAFDGAAVDRMKLANINANTCAAALGLVADEAFQTVKSWVLDDIGAGKEGSRWVCAQFRDGAGNWSAPVSDAVYYDTNLPGIVGNGILINGGDPYATSVQVQLALGATGAGEMMLGLDAGFSGGAWEPFAPTKTWTFAAGGDGIDKTVYVKFRDASGNVAGPYSDSITVDTVAPATLTLTLDGGAEYASAEASYTRDVTFEVTAGASSWSVVQISDDVGFQNVLTTATPTTVFPVAVSLSTANRLDGAKVVYARFFDAAGNTSAIISRTIVLDSQAPTPVAILVNAGATSTSAGDGVVNLTMSAADSGSGVLKMRLSNIAANVTAASDEPYNGSKLWALDNVGAGLEGQRHVWLQVSDRAGNWSSPSNDAILYDTLAPTVNAIAFLTAQPSASRTADVQFDVTGATEMMLGHDLAFSNRSWESYSANRTWTFNAGGDGVARTLYAKFRDAAGNVTTEWTADFTIDDVAPQSPVIAVEGGWEMNTNAEYSRDLEFAVTNLATTGSWYRVQIAADVAFTSVLFDDMVFNVSTPLSLNFTAVLDGITTVYARFYDEVGNVSQIASDTFVIDQTPPVITAVMVNDFDIVANPYGAYVTAVNGQFTLEIAATDNLPGAMEEDVAVWGTGSESGSLARQAFAPQPKTVQLTEPASGSRNLMVKVYDLAGNEAVFSRWSAFDYRTTGDAFGWITITDLYGNNQSITQNRAVGGYGGGSFPIAAYQVSEDPTFTGATWITPSYYPYGNQSNVFFEYTFATSSDYVTRNLYFRYRDPMGLISSPATDDIILDDVAPPAPVLTVAPSYYVKGDFGVTHVFDASTFVLNAYWLADPQPDYMLQYPDYDWFYYDSQPLLGTVSNGDQGPRTLYFRASDGWNYSAPTAWNFFYDSINPGLTSAALGASLQNTEVLTLTLDASDDLWSVGSGLAKVIIALDPSCDPLNGWTVEKTYAGVVSIAHPENYSGTHAFNVCVADNAGNVSASIPLSIDFDFEEPVANTFAVNAPGDVTGTPSVTVTATSADGGAEVQIANEPTFAGSTWQPVGTALSWVLTSGDGTKTVYARFRDTAGNISANSVDTVLLDTQGPIAGTLTLNGGASPVSSTTVAWAITASDNLTPAGNLEMQVSGEPGFGGETWVPYATSGSKVIPAGDGLRSLYLRFRDNVGNTSLISSGTFTLDQTGPQVSYLLVNGGNGMSNGSIAVQYQIGNWGAGDKLEISEVPTFDFRSEYAANAGSNTANFTLTPPDGMRTVYVRAKDTLGNVSTSFPTVITRDTAFPSVAGPKAIVINDDDLYTQERIVNLNLMFVSGADEMMISASSTFAGASWEPYALTSSWVLEANDGVKTLYAKFRDTAGNVITGYSDSITLDTTAPSSPSVSVNGGATYTNNPNVNLTLSASGADSMQIDNAPFFGLPPIPYATSYAGWPIITADGVETVYVRYLDKAGNYIDAEDSIILDMTPPRFASIQLAGGATVATSQTLDLVLSAVDNGSGLDTVDIAQNVAFTINLQNSAYDTSKTYTLSDGTQGTRSVVARFYDKAGNVSSNAGVTFNLDTVAPTLGPVVINGGQPLTNNTLVALTLTAGDAPNWLVDMQISEDAAFSGAAWLNYRSNPLFTLSSAQGTKTVYVRVRDGAGQVSGTQSNTISLDTLPPAGLSAAIAAGAAYTNTVNTTLDLGASDDSAILVRITGDVTSVNGSPANINTFIPYAASMPIVLTAGEGVKNVNVVFRDEAGNANPIVSDGITLDTLPPDVPTLDTVTGGHHTVRLTWQQVALAAAYDVEYGFTDGPGTAVAFEGGSPYRYTGAIPDLRLTGLPNMRNFAVRIRSVDAAGNTSGYSAAMTAGTGLSTRSVSIDSGSLSVVGQSGESIYMLVGEAGYMYTYHSSDGGKSWSQTDSDLFGGGVKHLTTAGTREGLAYAIVHVNSGATEYLYLMASYNQGRQWSLVKTVSSGAGKFGAPQIAVVGSEQVFICAAQSIAPSGVYLHYLSDGGANATGQDRQTSTRIDASWGYEETLCDVTATPNGVYVAYQAVPTSQDSVYFNYSETPANGFATWGTIRQLGTDLDFTSAGVDIGRLSDGTLYVLGVSCLDNSPVDCSDVTYRLYKSTTNFASSTVEVVDGTGEPASWAQAPHRLSVSPEGKLYIVDKDRLLFVDPAVGFWSTISIGLNANQNVRSRPVFFGSAPYIGVYNAALNKGEIVVPYLPPPALSTLQFDDDISFQWSPVPDALGYGLGYGAVPYSSTEKVSLANLTGGVLDVPLGSTNWLTAHAYDADGRSENSFSEGRATFGAQQTNIGNAISIDSLAGDTEKKLVYLPYWGGASSRLKWTNDGGVNWYTGQSYPSQIFNVVWTRNGVAYGCDQHDFAGPNDEIFIRRWTAGRFPELASRVQVAASNLLGDCSVAADGLGRVAFITYDVTNSWLRVYQSTDHGNTFASVVNLAGIALYPTMKVVYDVFGGLWVLYTPTGSTTTNWRYYPNGVNGNNTIVRTGTVGNYIISSNTLAHADSQGYVHFLQSGTNYLRTSDFDTCCTLFNQFTVGGYAMNLFSGKNDDLYTVYSDAGGSVYVRRSLDHGRTWEQNLFTTANLYGMHMLNGSLFLNVDPTTADSVGDYWQNGATMPRFDNFASVAGTPGLMGYYFNGIDFNTPVNNQVDGPISFNWLAAAPLAGVNADNFSIRWLGNIYIDSSATHTFYVTATGGARLWIDGDLVINSWTVGTAITPTGAKLLTPGWHKIRLDYVSGAGNADVLLEYSSPTIVRTAIPASKLTRFYTDGSYDLRSGPAMVYSADNWSGSFDGAANPGTGTQLALTAGTTDTGYYTLNLPFTFNMMGWATSIVRISTNGILDFDQANSLYTLTIPQNNATYDYIASVFGADLDASSSLTTGVYYATSGVAPFRKVVITWYDWARWGQTADRLQFQAILYETTNEIEFRYANTGALSPMVGVNRGNGVEGLTAGAAPTVGTAFRFVPNPDAPCRMAGATGCY